jgi:hypothetical protein
VRAAEVVLGRGLDAVDRAGAELRDVEVGLEDLVLAHPLLERDRQLRLAQLARVALDAGVVGRRLERGRPGHRVLDRLGRLDLHVLDVLLRQRRRALCLVAELRLRQGTQHALGVDARVLVEPLVLDRDDGLLHDRRDLRERDDDAVLVVERRQLRAVRRQDHRLLRQRREVEVRRQVVERLGRQVRRAVGQGHGRQGEAGGEDAADARDEDEREEERDALGRVTGGAGGAAGPASRARTRRHGCERSWRCRERRGGSARTVATSTGPAHGARPFILCGTGLRQDVRPCRDDPEPFACGIRRENASNRPLGGLTRALGC